MPEGKNKTATEGADTPEMPEPALLTSKEEIEGKTLLVKSWRENASRFVKPGTNEPLPPYLIYDAVVLDDHGKETDESVSFSGGQVMDDQAKKMNEPFRATVRKAKGKRYWQFRKPGA